MTKKRIMGIGIIVAVIVLLAAYGFKVYKVNADGRKAVYKYYEKSDECIYMGCKIEVRDASLMGYSDFREKYDVSEDVYKAPDSDENVKMCEIHLKYTKVEDCQNEYMDGPYAMDTVLVNNYWSSGNTNPDLFYYLNPDSDYNSLAVGESVDYIVALPLVRIHFNSYDWEHVWEEPMYIMMNDYKGNEFVTMLQIN